MPDLSPSETLRAAANALINGAALDITPAVALMLAEWLSIENLRVEMRAVARPCAPALAFARSILDGQEVTDAD